MKKNNFYELPGTLRARSPEQTLATIKPFFNHIGITRIANITGLDTLGVPCAVCVRPNSKNLSVAQGKGLTQELAVVSACMESIERWHAENILQPDLYGNYKELEKNKSLIAPVSLTDNYFDNSFFDDIDIGWIKATNLANNKTIFVPYDFVSLDTTRPTAASIIFGTSSNGLASGNNYHEAVCHALFELIERYNHYWWKRLTVSEKNKKQLDLNTVDSIDTKSIINTCKQSNIDVAIWDMSSVLSFPSFLCVIRDPNPLTGLSLFSGKGCHINKHIALTRAITEAAQSRLTLINGARDDLDEQDFLREVHSEKFNNGTNDCRAINQPYYENFFDDILEKLIQELLKKGFMEIACIDLTLLDANLSVVKTIIPKMQNDIRR